MEDIKLKDSILLLLFFPVYFTVSGIYKYNSSDEIIAGGLILPFTFILGIYSVIYILIKTKKNYKIKIQNKLGPMVILLMYTIIIHTIIGYLKYQNISSLLLNFQYLSGILGIFIAFYFIKYQDIKVEKLFFNISIIFLFAIISHIIYSIYEVGSVQTFGRTIYPSTPLGGIHQMFVYYPFIISVVFLFALPLWEKKGMLILPVYTLVSTYIVMIQVRGAIISFVVGIVFYFVVFSKENRLLKFFSLMLIVFLVVTILPKEVLLGRFTDTSSSVLSGREKVWKHYITNLLNDPFHIIRGSYSKATTSEILNSDPMSQGIGSSFHNQYIEILDSYGIFIFILFAVIIIYYLYLCFKKIKYLDQDKINYYYWMFLVIIHLLIDLNVNVPIRVTNSSIIYLFYWTALYLSIQKKYNTDVIIE